MRIAVNARSLIAGRIDGIARFTREVFRHMTATHPDHDFLFIFDRPFPEEFLFSPNITPAVAFPARHPILWYLWFEVAVPRLLRKFRADVFVSPDGFLSLASSLPSVAVIHDLGFHHHPRHLPPACRAYYNHFFPRYARKASRIATVSDYSARDIAETYGLPSGKIRVVGNGVDSRFAPLDAVAQQSVRKALTGGRPYILYVGSLHPRKNIVGLLRAFDEFRDAADTDMALVLAGATMFNASPIREAHRLMRHRADVVFTGPVGEERLPGLYGAARALVFVPFFEGFGLPLIEAMRSEVPVVASSRTAMPEVVGDAAILVNPESPTDIARAMAAAAFDEGLRSRLIAAGRLRARNFTWPRVSDALWECVRQAVEAPHA